MMSERERERMIAILLTFQRRGHYTSALEKIDAVVESIVKYERNEAYQEGRDAGWEAGSGQREYGGY